MGATGSTEQELQFEVGKNYLIRGKLPFNWNYQEVYVEKITECAYKFRKECSDGTWYIEWVGKSDFSESHHIMEYLETPLVPPLFKHEVIKIEINRNPFLAICMHCYGKGMIPDTHSTAGETTCPNCWGSGHVMTNPE
jgi:hypothetical protein